MDDGQVELSDHVLLSKPDSSSDFQNSTSLDSFLDEFLKNTTTTTCTHTHTCNPPGPDDDAHTHTCYHTHTQVLEPEDTHLSTKENSSFKSKRPSGNREAVRKYREKKKAHTAYLEEEVKKLQTLNQQLIRKLQRQAILEVEVLRLRSLLVDLKSQIDNELGAFPFRKQRGTSIVYKEVDSVMLAANGGAISSQCQTNLACLHRNAESSLNANIDGLVSWEDNCQPAILECQANANTVPTSERQTPNGVHTLVLSASPGE